MTFDVAGIGDLDIRDLYVVADDAEELNECHEDDNTDALGRGVCQ